MAGTTADPTKSDIRDLDDVIASAAMEDIGTTAATQNIIAAAAD
jgi:hypothetical protein